MVEVPAQFTTVIATITEKLTGREVEPQLASFLNSAFPADGEVFRELEALCRDGVSEGWLCAREAAGIRFGRAIKAGPETHGYSVDVVEMTDIVGPHHRHPNGEIDMVMPLDAAAQFDEEGRGWKVYGPGSAHHPTVTGGRALILYLLPEGAIEFTRA
jgi:hypothetical protein